MVKVKCPFPDCTFEAENDEAVVTAALLNIHATAHTATAIAPSTSARADKLKRPSVLLAGTGEEWAYFVTRWNEYREGTKLTGADVVAQLLECCDDDLRRDLIRAAGGTLTGKGEAEVLAAIKTLAVRQENIMVARATLHNMRQDRDEAIRSFGARIKGQAGICKYTTTCPRDDCNTDIDYTDAILRDVLARGIADQEIQLDILGDQNQSMSLEDMLRFVEANESGKRSASRLLDPANVSAASSTYRRAKQHDRGKQPDIRDKTPAACTYCGGKSHGRNAPLHVRRNECRAYDHLCAHCGKRNHFEGVCLSKGNSKPPRGRTIVSACEQEAETLDQLCTVEVTHCSNGPRSITLDHHLYNNLSDRWTRQASRPQPYIRLTLSVNADDYADLGFELQANTKALTSSVMADTGCQSCLAGIQVIEHLGLTRAELIPVTMKMNAANETTGITPPSSLHGAATGTVLHRRATPHPETDIHDAMTRSSPTSLGKPSVSTTPCYGLTPWRRVSSKPPTGSTSAAVTA